MAGHTSEQMTELWKKRPDKWSEKVKEDAGRLYGSGVTLRESGRRMNIPWETLRSWQRRGDEAWMRGIAEAKAEAGMVLENRDNFPEYAKQNLFIKTKAGELIPFVLNPIQEKVHELVEGWLREHGCLMVVLLKARQWGGSTYISGRFYHKCTTRKHRYAMLIANKTESTEEIFKMQRCFQDHHPHPPKTSSSNRRELIFKDKRNIKSSLESQINIQTAGGEDAGRAMTIQYLHASEVAFWNDAYTLFAGLANAVPDVGSEVFVESTANGPLGYFHDEYFRCASRAILTKRGWKWKYNTSDKASDYLGIFIPWFMHDRYSRPQDVKDKNKFEASLTPVERGLITEHEITLPQIAWRRYTIRNKCHGSLDEFNQEFPTTDDTCWIRKLGLVYRDFDRAKHVIKPIEIPPHWPRARIVDYGFKDPFYCARVAIEPGKKIGEGTVYVYEEFHKSEMAVSEVVEFIRRGGPGTVIVPSDKPEITKDLRKIGGGVRIKKAPKTDGSYRRGLLTGALRTGRIKIFSVCTYLPKEFSLHCWPKEQQAYIAKRPQQVWNHGIEAVENLLACRWYRFIKHLKRVLEDAFIIELKKKARAAQHQRLMASRVKPGFRPTGTIYI